MEWFRPSAPFICACNSSFFLQTSPKGGRVPLLRITEQSFVPEGKAKERKTAGAQRNESAPLKGEHRHNLNTTLKLVPKRKY